MGQSVEISSESDLGLIQKELHSEISAFMALFGVLRFLHVFTYDVPFERRFLAVYTNASEAKDAAEALGVSKTGLHGDTVTFGQSNVMICLNAMRTNIMNTLQHHTLA